MDIKQTLFWGQLGRKLYDWEFYEEALAVFCRRAEMLEEMESEWVMSAYGWKGLLLDLLGRRGGGCCRLSEGPRDGNGQGAQLRW